MEPLTTKKLYIPVVYATDNEYALPTFVSIFSLFINAAKTTKYSVFLLIGENFSEKNKKLLQYLQSKFKDHTISIYDMKNKYSDLTSSIPHITIATYYRLEISSILPIDIDKCLYIDGDTIVMQDLAELFTCDINNFYLAGVKAPGYLFPKSTLEQNCKELEIENLDTYINAGVLLMNLNYIRKDNLEETFHFLIEKNYSSMDQHILNKACYGRIKVLEPRYNAMTKYECMNNDSYSKSPHLQMAYSKTEWENVRLNPVILHFADKTKPWSSMNGHCFQIWWEYAFQFSFSESFALYNALADKKLNECTTDLNQKISAMEQKFYECTTALDEKINNLDSSINNLKMSKSYRIGRAITFLPRKIKKLFKQ